MNENTHIYLYAKGWYQETDTVRDLRIIIGRRNAISPEYISNSDIIIVLCGVLYPLIGNEWHFAEVVRDLINCHSFDSGIRSILTKISLCKITGLDIGKPDPNILPLRK